MLPMKFVDAPPYSIQAAGRNGSESCGFLGLGIRLRNRALVMEEHKPK
jgi:hypothetical protein